MYCPNCGLANSDTAKFCANCGTPFGTAPSAQSSPYQGQSQQYQPPPYQAPGLMRGGNSTAKNIGIGCLIFVVILLLFGLSCTRACFGLRHRTYIHRRY
jgi:uncharacterized membrane protein YvbJ